ncbi:LysE family translocator [Serratia entomophila]|uniref:LysE family translocator n=1 Tax=Serratia entomophila TaxID=42906 RepID=UPI0021783F27|nr:LysE family translocator [Serratia entomophila]CAI1076019.1 Homoserine/homoserine lactone efflux protein [Serratia entomophila]CAI1079626.1 Homoserine/homoserine lactone efflux protein [Serratia entomophila]CAI1092822.1 Homoserine/homoserine lactone efflux protein [Serratia entomophila]CAI1879798.1 Homoserine/homoserine lactone efflux protein [Serratia entomophila]CAI1883400.1 Homoserine/homoserine lactone efflux protein [Serratia entomophila]
MTPAIFAAFWAVSILFIITPGVDWAYVISAGIRGRVVVPAVAGLLFGHLLAIAIVAAGVGALVAGSPLTLTVLTVVGAAYLLWIGANMLRHPPVPDAGERQSSGSWMRWAGKGVCVSGMNPKVFLLFLALLPQFTDPHAAWPIPLQILALGLLHLVSCGLVYLLVGYGSQSVLQTRPQAARRVSRLSGAAMVIIAIGLLAGQAIK